MTFVKIFVAVYVAFATVIAAAPENGNNKVYYLQPEG